MIPIRILGATRVLAKDQPEYIPLAIRDSVAHIHGIPMNFMTSKWELSPKEQAYFEQEGNGIALSIPGSAQVEIFHPDDKARKILAAGGHVLLSILGVIHPPVHIFVCGDQPTEKTKQQTLRLVAGFYAALSYDKAPVLVEASA